MSLLLKKYEKLKDYFRELQSVAVAFSGGVDSTFLLKTAVDVLGADRVLAVTASSCSFPARELEEAKAFCRENGIRHIVCTSEELDIDGFRKNPKNRCYLCKRELFEKIRKIAEENGLNAVAEGSNVDDNGDYWPGLPTWDKPSFACLSSRFPYGETISEEKLAMVDRAEQSLLDMGFRQLRVRIHGNDKDYIARIEILPSDFTKLIEEKTRLEIYDYMKSIGFSYIALDLKGYRTGSMNETLDHRKG